MSREPRRRCGLSCDCSSQTTAERACTSAADCARCDPDGNQCNGTWTCTGGECIAKAAVACVTSGDTQCRKTKCVPGTEACETESRSELCADGNSCTIDTCSEAGVCGHQALSPCGTTDPCIASTTPGSNDPATTACVCALDPYCCDTQWDDFCVTAAKTSCGEACP